MRKGETDERRYQVPFIIIKFIIFPYSFLHKHTTLSVRRSLSIRKKRRKCECERQQEGWRVSSWEGGSACDVVPVILSCVEQDERRD